MATLADIQTFALGNPDFKQRFESGRVQVAWNILAEPNGGTAPRAAWRLKIFNNTKADIDREYIWFLSHPNVQNGTAMPETPAGDAALVTAVASFVDTWAAIQGA